VLNEGLLFLLREAVRGGSGGNALHVSHGTGGGSCGGPARLGTEEAVDWTPTPKLPTVFLRSESLLKRHRVTLSRKM
jgi:hypothetical protein